jgi:hypothetical protein
MASLTERPARPVSKGCDWVGDETCFLHGLKVDAWPTPDVPVVRGFL